MMYFMLASYASIWGQSPPHPLNFRQFRTNLYYCHNQSPSWLNAWFTKGSAGLAPSFWAHPLKMPPGRMHGGSPKHTQSFVLEDKDALRGKEWYKIPAPTPIACRSQLRGKHSSYCMQITWATLLFTLRSWLCGQHLHTLPWISICATSLVIGHYLCFS